MTAVQCPSCEATLSQGELTDGWCETCGKKIPLWVAKQASGRDEVAPTEPPASRKGRTCSSCGQRLSGWRRWFSSLCPTCVAASKEARICRLIEALDDEDSDIRWEAVRALGGLGTAALP